MSRKFVALLLLGVTISGLIYTHPAYAHNFGGDESAGWLAKVSEIKTEVTNVAKHVGQRDALDYYNDALGEYWNSNTTKEMGEKNTLLQKEIPTIINATITDANAGNQNMVNNDVAKLSGYLDESIPVRVTKDKLTNSTVQALAITFVLKEALEKYGNALNSTIDLNDMSKMNMSGNGMSSGNMSDMSASTIVNGNAYENSVSLATAAKQMFTDLASKNPGISDNAKLSDAFTKLVQDLKSKVDVNTIMIDTHQGIHPTLIMAYNIHTMDSSQSSVPEFSLPATLIIISIAGVVIATRLKSRIGF